MAHDLRISCGLAEWAIFSHDCSLFQHTENPWSVFHWQFLISYTFFVSLKFGTCVFIIFISFFDEMSNFHNRVLTSQKQESAIINCQWSCMPVSFWDFFINYGKQITRSGTQPEIFQDRKGFVELKYFNKYFVKKTRKKDPAVKNFGFFSPRYS